MRSLLTASKRSRSHFTASLKSLMPEIFSCSFHSSSPSISVEASMIGGRGVGGSKDAADECIARNFEQS